MNSQDKRLDNRPIFIDIEFLYETIETRPSRSTGDISGEQHSTYVYKSCKFDDLQELTPKLAQRKINGTDVCLKIHLTII